MRNLLLIFILCLNISVNGQKNLSDLIKSIDVETQLFAIDPNSQLFKIGTGTQYLNFRHNYLIHNKELHLLLDGTGKIYKLDTLNNKLIRLDSTYFDGVYACIPMGSKGTYDCANTW